MIPAPQKFRFMADWGPYTYGILQSVCSLLGAVYGVDQSNLPPLVLFHRYPLIGL